MPSSTSSPKTIWSKISTTFSKYSLPTDIKANFVKLATFVLVSFLLASQITGHAGNLISPGFEQKAVITNLLRSLGLDDSIKASAQVATPTYFSNYRSRWKLDLSRL